MSTSPSESSQSSKEVTTDELNQRETVEEKDQLTGEKNEDFEDLNDLMARILNIEDDFSYCMSNLSQISLDLQALPDLAKKIADLSQASESGADSKEEVTEDVKTKLEEGQSSCHSENQDAPSN